VVATTQMNLNASSEDINIDTPRRRSAFSSSHSFRAFSTHSAVLSIPYYARIEQKSNHSFWAD